MAGSILVVRKKAQHSATKTRKWIKYGVPGILLKVRTAAGAGTKLKAVIARPEVLDVVVGPADSQGIVSIDLTVRKETRYGRLTGEIRLEFDGKEKGPLAIPFAGYVREQKAP